MSVWEPRQGDVAAPRDASFAGRYVVKVVASFEDKVTFTQIKKGVASGPITNRLSTFISRFELLHRPLVVVTTQGDAAAAD